MTIKNVMFLFATAAMSIAAAASSYDVKFAASTWVGATELKAGEYKVQVQGDKAIFKNGKTVVEVPATLSTGDRKFGVTSVAIADSKVKEIEFGGTKSKIVFSAETPAVKGN